LLLQSWALVNARCIEKSNNMIFNNNFGKQFY
jgi:hypothetical protein